MLFSGIDLHKRSVAIHTLDAEGTVVRGLPTAVALPELPRRDEAYPGHPCEDDSTLCHYLERNAGASTNVSS
jgi:hypothetical protein